jgi:hypothetical protein
MADRLDVQLVFDTDPSSLYELRRTSFHGLRCLQGPSILDFQNTEALSSPDGEDDSSLLDTALFSAKILLRDGRLFLTVFVSVRLFCQITASKVIAGNLHNFLQYIIGQRTISPDDNGVTQRKYLVASYPAWLGKAASRHRFVIDGYRHFFSDYRRNLQSHEIATAI